MIDLLSEEQVQQIIEERKEKFKLQKNQFYVLTPLEHLLFFCENGDVTLVNENLTFIEDEEVAEIYGLVKELNVPLFYNPLYPSLYPFSDKVVELFENLIQQPEAIFLTSDEAIELAPPGTIFYY